jgi:hypothetical protein
MLMDRMTHIVSDGACATGHLIIVITNDRTSQTKDRNGAKNTQ